MEEYPRANLKHTKSGAHVDHRASHAFAKKYKNEIGSHHRTCQAHAAVLGMILIHITRYIAVQTVYLV